MGWVLGIFGWTYALFEIPGGWLADRIGPRRVLMRIVLWWSFFTAATGWAWNFTSLIVARALFGAGEAGCYPSLTRVFTIWLPRQERERAQAMLWLVSRWSGAFTPLLVVWVLSFVSWRRAFELFGVLGAVWAIAFYWWYRDAPGRASSRESGRARAAAVREGNGARRRRHSVAPARFDARRSGCCAFSTRAWPTAGGSTSRGCRPTCAKRAARR